MSLTIRKAVFVTDDDGSEALYIDGKFSVCTDTFYACNVAHFLKGEPVIVCHVDALGVYENWPENLSQLELESEGSVLLR